MKHTEGKLLAYVENRGNGHYGEPVLVTQKHLDKNLPPIATVKSPHDANHLVKCWNEYEANKAKAELFGELVEALEGNEWVIMDVVSMFRCPSCMNSKRMGHRHDCKVGSTLERCKKIEK